MYIYFKNIHKYPKLHHVACRGRCLMHMYMHIHTCACTCRGVQEVQEVTLSKTQLLETGVVQKCMGCHGRQASLGFTTSLHHDQHLPDQPCSTAGASTPQQVPSGAHPNSSSIPKQQQASHPIPGWRSGAAFSAVCRRVLLSVSHWH